MSGCAALAPRRESRPPVAPATIRRAQALAPKAAPWWLARHWPESPVVDRRAFHQRIGCRIGAVAHSVLGIVRKAEACRFAGVQVGVPDLAARLHVSERQVFRALATLEELQLVRRVHQFTEVPWTCPATKRAYRRRQCASVLLLGPAAGPRPTHPRRTARADRSALTRVQDVTPKPTPSLLRRERGGGSQKKAGCAGEKESAAPTSSTRARSCAALELAALLEQAARPEATPEPGRAPEAGEGEGRWRAPLDVLPDELERLLTLRQPPLVPLPAPPRPPPCERPDELVRDVAEVPRHLRPLTLDERRAWRAARRAERAPRKGDS